jgi:chromosome segregation ATPase
MKGKVGVIILLIICVFLAVFIYLSQEKAKDQEMQASQSISRLSDGLTTTSNQLAEQKHVNDTLMANLDSRTTELLSFSNKLENVSLQLAQTQQEAENAAKAAQEEVAKRDARISKLEGQNDEMTGKIANLNGVLSELEKQIAETERKLSASEGDREFLLVELKRLQAEKAELERQLTDLSLLRDQIRKLRDELSIARRLEWIRQGLYGSEQRGAERLEAGHATPAQPGYDLNVEIRQDGDARVVEPTNNPAPPPDEP